MNHNKIQELIPLYLENKLKPSQRQKFKTHIKECRECGKFFNDFKETAGLINTLKLEGLPEGYFDRLDSKITNINPDERKPFLFNPRIFAPTFAILLIAIGIGYLPTFLPRPLRERIEVRGGTPHPESLVRHSDPAKAGEESHPQFIETKKTIQFAKANPESRNNLVLRGVAARYLKKKIIKQWQDTTSGIKTKQSLIIKKQKEWEELWKRHSNTDVPEVDFNTSYVITVFMGEQRTDGYGIQISQIEESENNIYVELTETAPGQDAIDTQVLTQPYHIVVISKD